MNPSINWTEVRKQFPITDNQIYLMNAAVAGLHRRTLNAAQDMLNTMANKGAIADDIYFGLIQNSKEILADFIHSTKEEVVFTPNTSHNMNVLAMLLKQHSQQNKIIAVEDEFPSSVVGFYHQGFQVDIIPKGNHRYEVSDFEKRIDDKTAAIVLSGIQYGTGFKMPVKEIAQLAKKMNIPVFLNATQLLGQAPLNIKELGVQAMSASCHKWLGAGIGLAALYVSAEFSRGKKWPLAGWVSVDEPWLLSVQTPTIRSDAGVLGTGSIPFVNLAAIQEAIKVQKEIGIENIYHRILDLSQKLYLVLKDCGATVYSPRENIAERSGILNFEIPGTSSELIAQKLKAKNIFINHRKGRCRASIHYYNNESDIQAFESGLRNL